MYAVHNQYDFFVTELHADAKLREKFLRMMLNWYQGSSIITQFNQKLQFLGPFIMPTQYTEIVNFRILEEMTINFNTGIKKLMAVSFKN